MTAPITLPEMITPCSTILESNLYDALATAVRALKESESRISAEYRSCFRAGLEDNLAAMRAGKSLEIVRS